MLGPFATASRLTLIHQVSLAVLSRDACASMSTTTTTTTTMTTHDRGDRYGPMEWDGPMEWAQSLLCFGTLNLTWRTLTYFRGLWTGLLFPLLYWA